ncbi:hypothetical protein [Halovivax limisalsi]|uniref:hypothetical protein n=1 Tax=Halovivax limisalsi TaxID=1453760 RepID=UPI001FFDE1A4|nr:hypothetical protein [Halovivax limisalsi]
MSRLQFAMFSLLALGYAAIGFVLGRSFMHDVLNVEPIEYVPMPEIVLQLAGFGLVFALVIVGTRASVRLLNLDQM